MTPDASASRLATVRLPIRTRQELKEFVRAAWGVRIPDVRVCPGHSTPWDAFCDAYFATTSSTVWKGSRGFAGKSTTMAYLGLTEALTLAADVNVFGGSGDQTRRVHEVMVKAWEHPSGMGRYLASDPTKRETVLTNGAVIRALLASQRQARHGHPQRLRIDEVDEVDIKLLDATLGQAQRDTLATSALRRDVVPHTLFSSTHHHQDGAMSYVLGLARDRRWRVHEWCYRETSVPHGWVTDYDIQRKQDGVPAEMWRVEYELGQPSIGNRAFSTACVEAMFVGDAPDQDLVVVEAPVRGAAYAHGVDWGRRRHWAVVATLRVDASPMRLVSVQRARQPLTWPYIAGILERRVREYGGHACHDATGMGGDVLRAETEGGYLKVQAEGVQMVGRARDELFSNYAAAIERGELRAPRVPWLYEDHLYATLDDLHGTGHPPDDVVAMAMAYRAAMAAWRASVPQVEVVGPARDEDPDDEGRPYQENSWSVGRSARRPSKM